MTALQLCVRTYVGDTAHRPLISTATEGPGVNRGVHSLEATFRGGGEYVVLIGTTATQACKERGMVLPGELFRFAGHAGR